MITVAALNGVMFFGVPVMLSRVGPKKRSTLGFGEFLRGEFDTLTGPVSGTEVLIQVITVPLALSLGAVAIAFIVHASKIAY
jgi:type IV secretory pathway VirB2 component (pilin)